MSIGFSLNTYERGDSLFQKVVDYCKEKGLSICQFEKMCGIGNGVVAEWGKDSSPSLASLKKISEATGIPITEWIGGIDE